MNNRPVLLVVIATLLLAAFSYFGYSPDPNAASDAVAYADQAKEAIVMKNWIALGGVLVGFATWLYSWLTGKRGTDPQR